MNCNLQRYLREQEVVCLRLAKSSNDGTPDQLEWFKTAQVLMDRRKDHISACKKCKNSQA